MAALRAAAIGPPAQEAEAAGGKRERKPGSVAAIAGDAGLSRAAALQSLAALLWIPQAALLGASIAGILSGVDFSSVWPSAAGILALGILRSILDACSMRMAFRNARALLSRRRAEALAALALHEPLGAGGLSAGAAASLLAEQAEAIVPYLSRYRPARMRVMIVPPLILLCILFHSWVAGLILLVAAPLIPVFMALIGTRAKKASEAQLVALGGMNAFLLDRLRGMTTIRSMRAVEATAARLRADADNLRLRTMAVLRIAFLSSAVMELFAALGVAMVAVYVGFHLLGQLPFGAWGGKLTLGKGLFILLLAPAFFEPLRDLSAAWHDRAAGEAALEALARLGGYSGAMPVLNADMAGHGPRIVRPLDVRAENLRFRHAGQERDVFSALDLDIEAGEHVAVLAPSGGGKSTLLALMAGLAMPQCGRLRIGGEPVLTSAGADRHGIAWIGQNPHVFPGTLVGNVRLGRADIDPACAQNALRRVGLGTVLDRRGNALVGEGGVGLSGGEASRLALARIAARRDVGLILADEPTAHLDSETAAAVADTLLMLARRCTLVVATHDPVVAARMGRVVALPAQRLEDAA